MQQQALGQSEAALSTYLRLLKPANIADCSMPDEAVAFVVAQASQAYADLADWEGLEAFFKTLQVILYIFSLSYIAIEYYYRWSS